MDENVNAKLKRVIFLCIFGVALIVLAICWTKIAINVTDPSDTASHITKRPLPTAASQAPLPDEDDETDVTPGPEITGEITPELTGEPTAEPTKGTETRPTAEPTKGTETSPTAEPTKGTETSPTAEPTKGTETSPTAEPTKGTETRPTAEPTKATAGTPTGTPTPLPTKAPTNTPTPTPTKAPTNTPTPVPTKAPTGNSSYYGKLKVVGANLTDSNGNPVQLRGMSTHGIGWFPDYVNKAAFSDLKNWGCNLIRLAMYTAEGGYCDGGNKTQLKKMVTDGVQYATELDMYVIIDWHILHDNDPTKYKSEAKTFFDEMSKKYADNPHVLYEICNEPNSGTSWATVKKYAEEIIPVIRKNSPDAIIIVGTPTWCQDIDQVVTNPIKNQTNIMYAVHFYADTHKEWLRNKVTDAYKAKIPVFISEFGICDASGNGNINEEEADKWIELLDKYSISYANWSFCNKAESASFLKSSCTKKSGFTESDLSQSGKWMVKTLAKYKNGVATPTKAPAATPAPTKAPAATSTPVPTSKPGSPTNTPVPTSTPVPTPTNTPTPVPTSIPTPVPTATPTPIPEVKLSDLIVSADGLTYKESSDGWTNEKGRVISFTVEIKNNGTTTITDWSRTIVLKPGTKAEIFGGWCANVKIEGESIIITPVDYNKTIQPGGSISNIGIQLQIIYE